MKILLFLITGMWLLAGCENGARKEIRTVMTDVAYNLQQERTVADFDIRLTYLPMHWKKITGVENASAASQMTFRLRVKDRIPGRKPAAATSIHQDVFALVSGGDTLRPLLAERIADGGFNGSEFMVIFPRPVTMADTVLQFLFRDELFTNNKMWFPLYVHKINMIDSISSRL